jgi:hypothetical protein
MIQGKVNTVCFNQYLSLLFDPSICIRNNFASNAASTLSVFFLFLAMSFTFGQVDVSDPLEPNG